mmetsp:Transcript_35502/g.42762  ORF Transcript_35502/g.42762 Transcript_35502/m.42762 type:complete len:224 (-) Transcript_35502:1697-2368(-)
MRRALPCPALPLLKPCPVVPCPCRSPALPHETNPSSLLIQLPCQISANEVLTRRLGHRSTLNPRLHLFRVLHIRLHLTSSLRRIILRPRTLQVVHPLHIVGLHHQPPNHHLPVLLRCEHHAHRSWIPTVQIPFHGREGKLHRGLGSQRHGERNRLAGWLGVHDVDSFGIRLVDGGLKHDGAVDVGLGRFEDDFESPSSPGGFRDDEVDRGVEDAERFEGKGEG